MWLFNPGNPTRGTTKSSESDERPSFVINRQTSLPPFFRFETPAGGELEKWYPEAVGTKVCKRFYPNGKLVPDMNDGLNEFSYDEIPSNSNRMYRIYFGGYLTPKSLATDSYYYQLTLNGENVWEGEELSLDDVLAALSAAGGYVPINYNAKPIRVVNPYFDPPWNLYPQLLTFSLPADRPISIDSAIRSIHYDDDGYESSRGTVARERSAENYSGWHVEWRGGVIGPIQRPFLMYHQWIIGDLASTPPAWQGPLLFDVMSPVDLDLYEIVIASTPNPYGPDGAVRGNLLGRTTLYPAWS